MRGQKNIKICTTSYLFVPTYADAVIYRECCDKGLCFIVCFQISHSTRIY